MSVTLPATDCPPLRRHAWRAWVAALALVVQVLLPVQMLRAAGLPGEAVAFCSAAGNSPAAAGLDGGPLSDTGHKSGMVCPLCMAAGTAAVPPADPAAALATPVEFAAVDFSPADIRVASGGGSAAYGSRAPPALL